jgi:hypothetical protein
MGDLEMESDSTGAGLTWPTRCEMPDPSGLFSKTSIDVALNRMFCGGGPRDGTSHALLMNFNRVVDLLIADYEAARESLIAATEMTGGLPLPAFLRAISNFENCVTTATRAIHFGQRLSKRSRGEIIPRKLAVLSKSVEDRVREMRNAIEHLDGQITDGTLKSGGAHCLMPKEDRIELAGHLICFAELAEWVRELHGLATATAQYKEAAPPAEQSNPSTA